MRPILLLGLSLLVGCERPGAEPERAGEGAPSPNASILPAPLATAPPTPIAAATPAPTRATEGPVGIQFDSQGRVVPVASAPLPPPEPLRPDAPLPVDSVGPKETAGVQLSAEWRWVDPPAPSRAPEVHQEGIAAARKLTAFKWLVTATEAGRMNIHFDARAFPLPLGSELRARADRYGHVVVFPSGNEYRPVAPGALRALFGDRRLDVLPLMAGESSAKGAGPARLGRAVRKVELRSKLGTVQLDLTHAPEAGQGAALLCRTLVEMLAIDPATPVCARDELPLRAQFTWPQGGGLIFEVQDLNRRTEVPVGDVHCPPLAAQFAQATLPPQPSGVLLTRDEAAALRLRPIDLGPSAPGSPAEGIVAKNATDNLRYLVIDGVPIAWVMPGSELYIVGPPRGRYVAQWRSFLGDAVDPPRAVELPARLSVGEPPPRPEASTPAPAKSTR
jgi:hypothetical protein